MIVEQLGKEHPLARHLDDFLIDAKNQPQPRSISAISTVRRFLNPYQGRELAEPDPARVPEVRVERIPQASHWVQADAPERVNQLMPEFLQPSAANGQDAP
jgi:hypothetical protein